MWQGIDGRRLSVDAFAKHVAELQFTDWRPSMVVVHNTANPSLYPLAGHGSWHGSKTTPQQRVNESLVKYYRDQQGWSGGPHLFIDDEGIWLFTPLNKRGTHSPSWNGIAVGIEMVGDYDAEAFSSGPGSKVRDQTVAALAALCARFGWDPATKMKLHREDPKTTHACPGKNVDKADMIRRVLEYMAHGGGEHVLVEEPATPPPSERTGIVNTDGLNVRELSSASARVVGVLRNGQSVVILGEVLNGTTKWYRLKDPVGWVSARFVTV